MGKAKHAGLNTKVSTLFLSIHLIMALLTLCSMILLMILNYCQSQQLAASYYQKRLQVLEQHLPAVPHLRATRVAVAVLTIKT